MNNRYSLVSTYNGINTVIKINEHNNKDKKVTKQAKVTLPTIDLLTSNFESSQDFNVYFDLPKSADLSIVYTSNKELKYIPCIFSDNKLMRYFANAFVQGHEKIDRSDITFRNLINNFFVIVCRPAIKRHIIQDYNINSYIKDKIQDYLKFDYNEVYTLKKIESELQNYKNLRSIISNLSTYEKIENTKIFKFDIPEVEEYLPQKGFELSRFIPDGILDEPLFPPNSEEERKYNVYLENLPDEYSCHETKTELIKKL